MWMCDPKILCRQHLLGDHVELHMFLGHIRKGKRIDGYIAKNCLEMTSIESRHDELVTEMLRRGMNHKSPLPFPPHFHFHHYVPEDVNFKINREASLNEITNRCYDCQIRYLLVVECYNNDSTINSDLIGDKGENHGTGTQQNLPR